MSTMLAAHEDALVAALRARDERAFEHLVDRHTPSMLRLARTFVGTDAVAQEVVQETWLAVLTGIDKFEGRSSLSTWILRILVNRAKTRGIRERRMTPFSSFADVGDDDGPSVDADRFIAEGERWAGHWSAAPRPWDRPGDRLLSLEARGHLRSAMDQLPEQQRLVVGLRDVEGLDTEEVAEALDITPGHVRVLLHRGRSKLRQALEDYVEVD